MNTSKKLKGKKTTSRKPAKKKYNITASIVLILVSIVFVTGVALGYSFKESAKPVTATYDRTNDSLLLQDYEAKLSKAEQMLTEAFWKNDQFAGELIRSNKRAAQLERSRDELQIKINEFDAVRVQNEVQHEFERRHQDDTLYYSIPFLYEYVDSSLLNSILWN